MLNLYNSGGIRQPEIAKDYFHDYTFAYLTGATQGVERVFTKDERVIEKQSLDINEAADYTNVVFAWMHYFATSPYLPQGFSRRGMLKAPKSRQEFVQRVDEMKREIALMVSGLRDPEMPLMANPSRLRMHTFFHVGSILPIKFSETPRELKDREKGAFEKLLGDTDISL